MAMKLSIWKILTTDVRELNWGQSVEVTKTGAEAANPQALCRANFVSLGRT